MRASIREEAARKRIPHAVTQLICGAPWFGSLALKLKTFVSPDVKSIETNGTYLAFNEEFVKKLDTPQLKTIIGKAVLHCALRHPYRCGDRDIDLWNMACSEEANHILVEANKTMTEESNFFQLPPGAACSSEYKGMLAEKIYELMQKKPPSDQKMAANSAAGGSFVKNTEDMSKKDPDKKGKDNNKQTNPGGQKPSEGDGNGDGDDPQDGPGGGQPQPEETLNEIDWEMAAQQATDMARKQGKLSADLERMFEKSRESKVDWKTILKRFVENVINKDYSWTTPNRRFLHTGLIMPGMMKENAPKIAIGVDTSGSITEEMLAEISPELTQILLDVRPSSIDVYYCDAEVNHHDEYTPDDGEIVLVPYGGGGTAFQPVIDAIAEQDEPPSCLIYFTDLYGSEPSEPEYPVLWIVPYGNGIQEAWYGETVEMGRPKH